MALYERTIELTNWMPLKFPKDIKAYELRLIDDDEQEYTPFMEIGPRKRDEGIGQFDTLAFVQVPGYQQKTRMSTGSDNTKENLKLLELENKTMISVRINTNILQTNLKFIVMKEDTV